MFIKEHRAIENALRTPLLSTEGVSPDETREKCMEKVPAIIAEFRTLRMIVK